MTRRIIAGACATLVAVSTATAHHSFSMFDADREVTLEGTVAEYQWKNPHTHILIAVPDETGDPASAVIWDIEGASVGIMTRQGWNKGSFKPGDKIVIVANPLRNGENGAALVYAINEKGEKLYPDTKR